MRLDTVPFLTPSDLLAHWQGHRRLTRRVIAAFPEHDLFTFAVGRMRPFSRLTMEILKTSAAVTHGLATGEWTQCKGQDPSSRTELLTLWDEATKQLNTCWSRIPPERFQESVSAFGQRPMTAHDLVLYAVDNEVHHRGQGYVYLRELGLTPPDFQDRS